MEGRHHLRPQSSLVDQIVFHAVPLAGEDDRRQAVCLVQDVDHVEPIEGELQLRVVPDQISNYDIEPNAANDLATHSLAVLRQFDCCPRQRLGYRRRHDAAQWRSHEDAETAVHS
ncbi:hypothetical protein A5740_02950 [Mycobacterium sp. GA-1841]|nr:hypothetical protein A5740_02950 [Mycobacterium sp. GA-1841]